MQGVWERGGIVVDERYWPVLVELMPKDFPNDDPTLDAWMGHVDSVMKAHGSKFIMVVDALGVRTSANAHARKRMAQWLSDSADYQKNCLSTIYIVGSPLVRGALTAINWFTRPQPPRSVVASWGEALAESRTLLRSVGAALPSGVETYQAPAAASARV